KDEVEEEEEEIINKSEKKRNFNLNKVEAKVNVVIEKLKKEYNFMRIGRANPGLKFFFYLSRFVQIFIHLTLYMFFLAILDPVTVPFKDSSAPLKDIAQIIVKDPQTLLVHVHEEEVRNHMFKF